MSNFIFLGQSGSGKSTCCRYLRDKHGYYSYHPYRFIKRQYETLYRLPAGYLDTQEGKSDRAKGMTCTFQELMVKEYHFRLEIDPFYTSRNVEIELVPIIHRQQPICMEAIRNLAEVEQIKKLNIFYEIIILEGRGKPETSDVKYEEIKQLLISSKLCDRVHTLDNKNLPKEELYKVLDSLVESSSLLS